MSQKRQARRQKYKPSLIVHNQCGQGGRWSRGYFLRASFFDNEIQKPMAQRLCLLISPAYIIFDHMCEESSQEFLDCKSKSTGVRQQLLKQYKDVIPIDINNIVEDLNFHWHSHCTCAMGYLHII